MWRRRKDPSTLDVDALPPEVRAVVEAAIAGAEVRVLRGGRDLGTMVFRSPVISGAMIPESRLPIPQIDVPEGVVVVATAMRLSRNARQQLSDAFGAGFVVLDLNEAPTSTDILLVNPVSPQLLWRLRERFPRSRVIVTEIEDEELGVRYAGPVGRLLDAGAAAYLPPRPVQGIVDGVRDHLAATPQLSLQASTESHRQLPTSAQDPSINRALGS